MKHINTIEIKNFKSIRDAKIEDCKRVNVFIGYPNVGKSNILEALSLTSYFKKSNYRPVRDLCRFKRLVEILYDGDKQKDAEIRAKGYVFVMRLIDNNQLDFGITEGIGYLTNKDYALSNSLKYMRINKDGGFGQTSHKDYDDSQINTKKYDFRGMTRVSSDRNVSDSSVLDFPFGENLSEIIRYNMDLRKECGELFSSYNLKLVFDENQNILVQKQLDEFSAFQFSLSQIADTLQRLIFHKVAIATNRDTVLLFEEPEAHMFPAYISKLTADIMYKENNNQYFITTHSPFVLNDFMGNLKNDELSIYVVGYKKTGGETTIRRLNNKELHDINQYGIDMYMNLENYLPHEQ